MASLPFDLGAFERDVFPAKREPFEDLAKNGQAPRALIVSCADSRVLPELITGAEPGELFVCRNAGNIVPPYDGTGNAVSSAVEFAVVALGVPNVIVCGHSGCGAMAAFDTPDALDDLPQVRDWIHHSRPANDAVMARANDRSADEIAADRVEENVRLQIENLRTHPCVADALGRGALTLHGWVFEIGTGEVRVLDQASGAFSHHREHTANESR